MVKAINERIIVIVFRNVVTRKEPDQVYLDQENKPVTAISAPKCRTRLSTQLTPRYPANE